MAITTQQAICLGCRQSVGRGTRFNARKITTDQQYFSTKIYEFQLSCRNCQHPWVIRTNPKDRGFNYVSGVKRQAGQEKNLVTGSSNGANPTENRSACDDGNNNRRSLDHLEMAAVLREEKKQALTEIEELEHIRQLNEVSASGNDADINASIRNTFRRDRTEKRRRLEEASEKGWRDGMMMLPANDHDILAANDTCYGRPAEDEKRKLSSVRKSSIFSSGGRTKGKTNGRMQPRSSNRRANRTTTKIRSPSPVRSRNVSVFGSNTSGRTKIAAAAAESTTNPVANEMGSSSYLATDGIEGNGVKRKKTIQLRRGENGLSILGKKKTTSVKNEVDIDGGISGDNNIKNSSSPPSSSRKPLRRTLAKPPPSFSEMMTAYESDEDSY